MSRWPAIGRFSSLFVIAFGLGALTAFGRAVWQSNPRISAETIFAIEPGDGVQDIAASLKKNQLIGHERPFYLYILLTGRRNQLYPGAHQIPTQASLGQIVAILTDPRRQQTAVTILEGWRIADIAKAVAEKTKITEAEFLAAAPVSQYEGYLFPDTYFFSEQTLAAEAIEAMRQNFDLKTADLTLTAEDVILASIVEREAQKDEDYPQIAAVYLNRITRAMALEADPTVQYAKNSWAPISLTDYRAVVSPYNTYLNRGLPPTPISNPGLKSLRAVKSPSTHDYYYFFTPATGPTVYSKTLAEHNQNKAIYLR